MSQHGTTLYTLGSDEILSASYADLIIKGHRLGLNLKYKDVAGFVPKHRNVQKVMSDRSSLLYQKLLHLKYQRMSKSSFTFFRGSVDVMNYDLERYPNSGIRVLLGGDAHLGNFGYYGSPEGQLLFDMNDFDESHVGFWEYDVKRLLVSAVLVAKELQFDLNKVSSFLQKVMDTYLESLVHLKNMPAMERFIIPTTPKYIASSFRGFKRDTSYESYEALISKPIEKAIHSNSDYAVKKYTKIINGQRRFVENNPVTHRISSVRYEKLVKGFYKYVRHMPSDVQQYLAQFEIKDIVRHSVGIGSVGTLCYLVLLENANSNYLVLQFKQALPIYQNSINLTDRSTIPGEKIVNYQKILQSSSDIFLGYFGNKKKSFYVRQFKDMKSSIKLDTLTWESYQDYVNVCVVLLARAHSQSPTFPMIIGYLQSHSWMNEAFVSYSNNYLQQVELDFHDFIKRKENGK